MDDEYMYAEEEGAFMPEVNIFERIGYENGDTLEQIAMEAGVIPEARKRGERFTSKTWRFYVYVNASARRMIDEGIISNVTSREIPHILRQIEFVDNPGYKNPEAFVIGYAVTKSGTINTDELESILSRHDGTLKATDIVRYARLWISTTDKIRGR